MLQLPDAFCIHQLFPTSSSHSSRCCLLPLSPTRQHHTWMGISCGSHTSCCWPPAQSPCPSTPSPSTQPPLSFKNHFPRVDPLEPPGIQHTLTRPAHPQLSCAAEFMTRLRVPKSHPGQQDKQHPCPVPAPEAGGISLLGGMSSTTHALQAFLQG